MKKIITILTLLYSYTTLGQISIGNIEEKKPETQPQKTKIPIYDSLSDFSLQKSARDYLQYIGCQFYMPPKLEQREKTPDPMLYATHPWTKGYEIYDNYYTILSAAAKLKSARGVDTITAYRPQDFIQQANKVLQKMQNGVYFILKDKKSGDTLYWEPKTYNSKFIFVPFFVKQKSLYENKIFYYEGYQDLEEKEMNNRSNTIYIKPDSKLICKEVTLLKYSQVSDYAPQDRYQICYVLQNDKNQSFVQTTNFFYPEVRNDRTDGIKYFISEKEFLKKQKLKQIENSKNAKKKSANNFQSINFLKSKCFS